MTAHMLAERVKQVEAARQKHIAEAVSWGTPGSFAESMSRERFYGDLLDAAMDLADSVTDREDDLK